MSTDNSNQNQANNVNANQTTQPSYIGKIIITQNQPVTPLEFYAWVNEDVPLSSFLVAEDPKRQDNRLLAFVENAQAISTFKDPFNEYFSHEMGKPLSTPSTLPTTVRVVKCKVIYSSMSLTPVTSRLLIRRPTPDDLNRWIASSIPQNRRILGGLVKICNDDSNPGCWAPFYYDSEYLLGEEAAHINISGISGVATKTSYAIFLALSALDWAYRNGQRLAIVMFNVKGDDLLRLYRIPTNWEQLEEQIKNWDQRLASLNIALWRALRNAGVDFINLFLQRDLRINIFTYSNDHLLREVENERMQLIQNIQDQTYRDFLQNRVRVIEYSFELGDLGPYIYNNQGNHFIRTLNRDEVFSIFEKDDLSDLMVDTIDTFIETYSQDRNVQQNYNTFERLRDLFRQLGGSPRQTTQQPGQRNRQATQNLPLAGTDYRTALAIARRLTGFLSRARHILPQGGAPSRPIDVEHGGLQGITAGINVIQLYNLTDAEKRLVVTHVLNSIKTALETWPADERPFDKVLIFVDELNLYAPRGGSSISDLLRDIAARGRFLGLSLMGAEQFASLIDEEVYGNSATKVLGRQSQTEISKEIYRGLGDLKDFATVLDKGQMIIDYPLLTTPIIVRYPIPMHELFR